MSSITVKQPRPAVLHGAHEVALLGVEPGFGQEVGHADDAVERRADLVAHVGQKFALGLRGGEGLFAGAYEFGLRAFVGGDIAHDDEHGFDAAGAVGNEFRGQRALVIARSPARRGEPAGDGHIIARGEDLPQRVVPEFADVRGLAGFGVGLAQEPLHRMTGLAHDGLVDVTAAQVRSPAGDDVWHQFGRLCHGRG